MAQMTPEEFIEALESVTESLRNNKSANQQQAEQLLKSIGIDKTRADEVLKAGKQFGTSSATMVKSMYAGADSAKQMAASLDVVSTAIDLLIPGSKLFKFVLNLAVKAISGLTKVVTEQAQAEFKAYQDLSRVGAAGIEGMRGVFDNMQKFGYNISELDKMVALIAENSSALAKFSGTASQGADEFANAMNGLTHGPQMVAFEALGKTVDDINAAGGNYIKLQLQMGRTQKEIGNSLADGTKKYVYDLNRLQELTGTSADAIAKKQQEAFADSAYAALINRLSKGSEADQAQAKKLQETESLLASASAEQAKLFRRGIGGDVGAAGSLNFTAPRLLRDARDASTDLTTTMNNLKADTDKFSNTFARSYEYNAEAMDAMGGKFQDLTAVSQMSANYEERLAKIRKREEEATTDQNTKDMAAAKVAERERTANLQTMIQHGVGPATTALKLFTDATTAATKALPGTTGVSTGAGNAPVGPSSGVVPGKSVTIGGQVRTGGDRNWRNNNPGNIEYGKFAISMGAIGSDGRFAIFPTEEMGRKAADTLLKGKSYANLSAAAAINKWAPSNENDPKAYAANIAKQTGLDMNKRYVDMSPQEQAKFLDAMNRVEGGRAGSVSGPNSRYDAKTAGINPASTLPASYDSAQARAAAQNDRSEDILASFSSRLEEQNRLQREANDKLAAIRTNTR